MLAFTKGTTARFENKFYDWGDAIKDPTLVRFTIFNNRWIELENHVLGPDNKFPEGGFYFHKVVDVPGSFYYEWYGELDGLPTVTRGSFIVKQITNK